MCHPTPVPALNGIYFWWFKDIPPGVPIEGGITQDGYTLLYVGISPDKKSKPNSRANLRQRIKAMAEAKVMEIADEKGFSRSVVAEIIKQAGEVD